MEAFQLNSKAENIRQTMLKKRFLELIYQLHYDDGVSYSAVFTTAY